LSEKTRLSKVQLGSQAAPQCAWKRCGATEADHWATPLREHRHMEHLEGSPVTALGEMLLKCLEHHALRSDSASAAMPAAATKVCLEPQLPAPVASQKDQSQIKGGDLNA